MSFSLSTTSAIVLPTGGPLNVLVMGNVAKCRIFLANGYHGLVVSRIVSGVRVDPVSLKSPSVSRKTEKA